MECKQYYLVGADINRFVKEKENRMIQEKKYTVKKDAKIPFHNNVAYCIGTGRMGLALQKEYQEQLALVQEEIGFSHIRGHGLFRCV